MKHELRQMRIQGAGSIVNCSSIGGLIGGPGRAPYRASKHAVIGLTKSAAKEYGPHGVRINAVCRAPSTPRWSATWSPPAHSTRRGGHPSRPARQTRRDRRRCALAEQPRSELSTAACSSSTAANSPNSLLSVVQQTLPLRLTEIDRSGEVVRSSRGCPERVPSAVCG